jgi:ribonuclease T2
MRTRDFLAAAGIFLMFSAAAYAGKGGSGSYIDLTPGRFDYYVMALSWQPAFCEGHQDKKECISQTVERYDGKNLVLHGLWPNKKNDRQHRYAYCGVKTKVKKLDNPAKWCRMPKLNLADETAEELAVYMPGFASCLQNHEWYKHGSCSGLKANDYFHKANGMVKKMADTNFGRYISANIGQTVSSAQLMDEFEKDFGAGSRKSVNLFCDRGQGKAMLSEVRIYLKKTLPAEGEPDDLLALPDSSERGNCPEDVMIDRVGVSEN